MCKFMMHFREAMKSVQQDDGQDFYIALAQI
jgi:hypothetical protein